MPLVVLKNTCDPTLLFCHTQNILRPLLVGYAVWLQPTPNVSTK